MKYIILALAAFTSTNAISLNQMCPGDKGGDDRLKTVLKALADAPAAEKSCSSCGEDDSCSAKSSGKKAGKEAKKAVDKAMKKVEEK